MVHRKRLLRNFIVYLTGWKRITYSFNKWMFLNNKEMRI